MKKYFLLVSLILLVFSCGDAESKIIEPSVTEEKIEFPVNEFDQGEFMVIYRNTSDDSVSMSFIMVSNEIINEVKTVDFCEGVDALRQGKQVLEWIPINFNYSLTPESSVQNQNDHPNLISYNLPVGTYLVMLMDSKSCTKDNHDVFIVKQNKNFEGN